MRTDPEPVTLHAFVERHRPRKGQEDAPAPRVTPGWFVIGLFVLSEGGDPTCVDYRVRAVPNTRDLVECTRIQKAVSKAMVDEHAALPAPVPTAGGVPRYVFEEASQTRLLASAKQQVETSQRVRDRLSADALALLAAGKPKPGRPPARSLAETLRVLVAVEQSYADDTPLEVVARKVHMSRSALRDLLSWARHDAQPRLFTSRGAGHRGGALTPEARALLAQIEGGQA